MIKRTCFHLSWLITAAFIMLASTAGGALYYLSVKPLEISEYVDFLEYDFTFGESRLFFKKLKLFYDGSLQLRAEGLVLLDKTNGTTQGQIKQADLALSNTGLATGRFLVKHARVKDVNITVELLPNLIKIGSIPLKNIKKGSTTTDLVAFFNGANASSRWKRLKTMEMENVNILLKDEVRQQNWKITDANLSFSKGRFSGEKIKLEGMISNEAAPIKEPISLNIVHAPEAKNVRMIWELEDSSTEIIQPYLPPKLQNLLDSKGKLKIIVNILPENKVGNSDFSFELGKTTILPQEWFSKPISFKNMDIKGYYSADNSGTLHLKNLLAEDTDGVKTKFQGSVIGIEDVMKFSLEAKTNNAPFAHLLKYFPDKKMIKTTRWLEKGIVRSFVEEGTLVYNGTPTDLPHCKAKCGFKATVKYKDGELNFLPRVSHAQFNKGTFELVEDKIKVTAEKGSLEDQNLLGLHATIDNLFSPLPSNLFVKADKIEGSIGGVLNQIEKYTLKEGWRPAVKGQHESSGHISIPLGDDRAEDDMKMNITSNLKGLSGTVPHYEGVTFSAPTAQLKLMDKILSVEGEGTLGDGIKTNVYWQENLEAFGKHAVIKMQGKAEGKALTELLSRYNLEIEGQVPYSLSFNQVAEDAFNYILDSDLTEPTLSIKQINWAKPKGDFLHLKAKGSVQGAIVGADSFSLTGPKVDVQGKFKLAENFENSRLSFTPFKIGRTDANVDWDGENIKITGRTLDLSGVPIQFGKGGELPNFKGEIKLNNLYLEKDSLHEISGHFELRDKYLTNTELTAKTTDRSAIILSTYEEGGIAKLNLQAGNGGSFLRAIGLYKQMRDGQITLNMSFLKDGITGVFYFQDAYLQDAPVVVKLLSLLSLQELLSGENGILFDNISLPFYVRDNIMVLEESRFTGPSIGLRLSGKYNLTTTIMDFKGQLTPVESVNNLIGRIPIIGQLFTGSQEGVVVADFSVKGRHSSPEIFINPLSVVTPGIVKDIFGVFTDDKPPVKKPKQEAIEPKEEAK